MDGEDIRRIAADDMMFKMHVVEKLGGVEEAVGTLKKNDSELFGRVRTLETAPRRTTVGASVTGGGVAAVVYAVAEGIKALMGRGG
jgi:hypothetical protein